MKLIALPAAFALVVGCVTGPAPLAPEAPATVVRVEPPDTLGSDVVRFDTEPEGAALLINNRLRGNTPLLLPDLPPGRYKIEAEKDHYGPASVWLTHPGGGARYTLILPPLLGSLSVNVTPADATVSAGGRVLAPGANQVPAGDLRVHASAFGYLDQEKEIRVAEGGTATVDMVLAAAPFAARLLAVSSRRFDPRLGGAAGGTRLSCELSAPASGGELRVLDASGRQVSVTPLPPATSPLATVAWDGRAAGGAPLPDGRYRLEVRFRSAGAGGEESLLATDVTLSPRPEVPPASLWSGLSGLMLAPDPHVAAAGAGSFALATGVFVDPGQDPAISAAPVAVAARYGLAAGAELDAQAGTLLVASPPLPFLVSGGLKRQVLSPAAGLPLAAAATVRASLQLGSGEDPFTVFTGLAVGFPTAIELGPFALVLAPEVVVSPWRVTGDSTFDDRPQLTAWAYLRGGLELRLPRLAVGVSTAARTVPFADGAAIDQPVAAALEAHGVLPDGRLEVSAWSGVEASSWTIERVTAGTTFTYRY